MGKLRVVELFAGIGGFRLGIEQALGKENCEFVYVSEWDKYAAQIYEKNFSHEKGIRERELLPLEQGTGKYNREDRINSQNTGLYNPATVEKNFRTNICRCDRNSTQGNGETKTSEQSIQSTKEDLQQSGDITNHICTGNSRQIQCVDTRDITTVPTTDIPDHDLLVGGFPCQAFSIAGKRKGFDDIRGTLFFDIARIVKEKRPKYLLLENVKGLLSHDSGRTFKIILSTLTELHYDLQTMVLNSKNFGVPQNRERVFIIGNIAGTSRPKVFPIGEISKLPDESVKSDRRQPQTEIANTLRGGGMKADNTFIGTIDHDKIRKTTNESFNLDANYWKGPDNHGQRTVVGTLRTHKDGQGFREVKSGLAPTIPARAREDGSGQPVIAIGGLQAHQTPRTDGNSPTLPSAMGMGGGHTPMVAMQWQRTEKDRQARKESQKQGRDYTPFSDGHRELVPSDRGIVGALTSQAIAKDSLIGNEIKKIRRLTPTECARLQGFPDNWHEGVSDTQAYKCYGNAVTTNVVQAIIERMFP